MVYKTLAYTQNIVQTKTRSPDGFTIINSTSAISSLYLYYHIYYRLTILDL